MGKGCGFGKTILIGDQFVLQGVPAVLAAIPFQTVTTVERLPQGRGWTCQDNRIEVPGYKKAKEPKLGESYDRMVKTMNLDLGKNPIKITVAGDLLAGSGVGASAAICVSFVCACNKEFELNMDNIEINYVAWNGEHAYHGQPSGLDNTVSTFGGTILYRIENSQKKFDRVRIDKPIEVVLGNSGVTANTAELKGFLENQKKSNPDLFKQRMQTVTGQVYELKQALEANDLAGVGATMVENHKILIDMGLSHPRLIELCNQALDLGALGAKVTGGGRGGFMLALTPGKTLQDKVAGAFEKEGVPTIRATIGNKPSDPAQSAILK